MQERAIGDQHQLILVQNLYLPIMLRPGLLIRRRVVPVAGNDIDFPLQRSAGEGYRLGTSLVHLSGRKLSIADNAAPQKGLADFCCWLASAQKQTDPTVAAATN